MAPTSTSMWPASASRTSEFEATAAPTSNTMKVTSRTSAMVRARRSVSTAVCACTCDWPATCPLSWPSPMSVHVVGVREHLFDEAADVCVVHDIEDPCALTPAPHQARQAELGQVLRDGGRLRTDQLGQLVHRVLALQQRPDDPQPSLVPEKLEHPDGGAE